MFRCCAWLLCALVLAACSSAPRRGELMLGMEDAPQGKRLMWPLSAEIPRYLFAGQLIGEGNFKKPADNGAANGFLKWVVGLVIGEAQPLELQRPQSGAVGPDGSIYITDASRQAVVVFDRVEGRLKIWDRATKVDGFVSPVAVAVTPAGEVWVTDADLGFVVRLDPQGNPLGRVGQGQLRRPTGLAYDPAGKRFFVADTYAHDIKVYDDQGRLLNTIGRRGEGAGEFNFPTHLAYSEGKLYVTDTMNARVQVLSAAEGRYLRDIGSRGLFVGNLVRPKGVALDGDGNVYIVESYYDHLLVFDREGRFLMPIGGVGTEIGRFYLPAGVWVDARSRVYVADMFNGRVVVFQAIGGNGGDE